MTRWDTYPDGANEISAAQLTLSARTINRNLVRNPYMRGWNGGLPMFWGREDGTKGTITKQSGTGNDYTANTALRWSQASSDTANKLLQDLDGCFPQDWKRDGIWVTMRVKASDASFVRAVAVIDGTTYTGDYHTGGGAWEDLTVQVPENIILSGVTAYVGVDVATVGSTKTFDLDSGYTTMGRMRPDKPIEVDYTVFGDVGPVESALSRRSGSALTMLISEALVGAVRGGATEYMDFKPDFTTALGTATPNIVGYVFNPRRTGTDNWTAAKVRYISSYAIESDGLSVLALSGLTWPAGYSANILWLIEEQG